jgi:hypothetical protein
MDVNETVSETVDWVQLTQDWTQGLINEPRSFGNWRRTILPVQQLSVSQDEPPLCGDSCLSFNYACNRNNMLLQRSVHLQVNDPWNERKSTGLVLEIPTPGVSAGKGRIRM